MATWVVGLESNWIILASLLLLAFGQHILLTIIKSTLISPIHDSPSLVQTLYLGPVEDEGLDDFMLALGDGLVDGAAPEIVSLSDQTFHFFYLLEAGL